MTKVFDVHDTGNDKLATSNWKELNKDADEIREKYEALATENSIAIKKLGTDVTNATSVSKNIGIVLEIMIVIIAILSARAT